MQFPVLIGLQRGAVLLLAASAIAVPAPAVLALKAPATLTTPGERRPDLHQARVICEQFKRGNQMITRFCEDGYECDLANQKCVPGFEMRQRMEAERERREQEQARLNAELDRMRQRLEEQQRSMRRDLRRLTDATQRGPTQGRSDDWRRIPSPQYGRPNPGGGCSTISGLPGSTGSRATCGSGRGGLVQQPGSRAGQPGGTARVYQPPRPSPTPDPRLVWHQQQAQWNDYLRKVGDAIARTEPSDPARQALVAHRAQARKAFEEQNKVHVTEELPHDDMVDASGRSTNTAQQAADQSGQAGGGGQLGSGEQGGAAAGAVNQADAASSATSGAARAGERDLLAVEEACARARDRAARGGMALFAVADVPTQCLAEVNQLRAEAAARAGIDPAPVFSNSIDREIIRQIQGEFRPERPDAGPPDTRQKS